MSGKGHEHSWYWPTSLPCPRHCYRCGIQHPDDAMPPLVAASPVPPVVPDSEALDLSALVTDDYDWQPTRGDLSDVLYEMKEEALRLVGTGAMNEDRWVGFNLASRRLKAFVAKEASGSGVVPDKPALAPEHGTGCWPPLCPDCGYALFMDEAHVDCALLVASVPAVTDDEAAAQAFHEAYERLAPSFSYETRKTSAVPWANVPENNKRLMIAVIADLRSAGFLIVHHTKET